MSASALKLGVIGSTGSIGTQTLDIVRKNPAQFKVQTLAAASNWELMLKQIQEFEPQEVSLVDAKAAARLREHVDIPVHTGSAKVVASYEDQDAIVAAVVGFAGLETVLAALEVGSTVALANKETLVAGGELIMKEKAEIVPVDSEHNSLLQCMAATTRKADIKRVVLTASGGPFLNRKNLEEVTPEEALQHPNWDMGAKVTIDSATLMNKGLEMIEARWLFDIEAKDIGILVHPQSLVHAMIELRDGSSIAAISAADMRVPIAYALDVIIDKCSRAARKLATGVSSVNLAQAGKLEFRELDNERFPAVSLCYKALESGGYHPAVLNAANEMAVQRFLKREISFTMISDVVQKVLKKFSDHELNSAEFNLAGLREADSWARLAAS